MRPSDDSLTPGADLETSPEFALNCLFDDVENPSELTIFSPDGPRTATEWITAERAAAISVEEVR